jgi:hypothetical protein
MIPLLAVRGSWQALSWWIGCITGDILTLGHVNAFLLCQGYARIDTALRNRVSDEDKASRKRKD